MHSTPSVPTASRGSTAGEWGASQAPLRQLLPIGFSASGDESLGCFFFPMGANIWPLNSVTAAAVLSGLIIFLHTFELNDSFVLTGWKAGIYSSCASCFNSVVLTTQPYANTRVAISRGSLTGF